MNKQPKYYITKRMFGMIIQVPVTASEIETLHSQLMMDTAQPAEDPMQLSIFDKPEDSQK